MDCNPGEICKEITDLPGEFLVNPKCLCPLEMSCPSLDPQNVETIIFDDHTIVHNVRCEMTSRVSKMRNLGELLAIPPEKRRMRIYWEWEENNMILQQHLHQQSAAYLKANKVLKYAKITFSYLSLCYLPQAQREVMIFLFIVALIYVVWILTLLFLKPPNFPPGNYLSEHDLSKLTHPTTLLFSDECSVHYISLFPMHIVWKLLKMSHLNFWILAFFTNICSPIKTDLSGNTIWPQASGFQKLAKMMNHFWHF